MWNLSFTQEDGNVDSIESFLESEGGVTSFDWTPPHGSVGKWICKEWGRSKDTYGVDTLTAAFEEVFGE
jgi:phage-related protein